MCKSPLPFIFLWSDPLLSYGMKPGFAEKQFFKLRKIVFFAHAWNASNPRRIYMWIDLGTWNIVFPITWWTQPYPESFFSTLLLWNSDKPGFAKKKSGSKKLLFSALLFWNSDKPGFAKKNQALKIVFCALLLWNSDKPGFAKKNWL